SACGGRRPRFWVTSPEGTRQAGFVTPLFALVTRRPPVPRGENDLLSPIADHRHHGRAVWIDTVVLRAITIARNDVGIPIRIHPYLGRDVKPVPRCTHDMGLPRLRGRSKSP